MSQGPDSQPTSCDQPLARCITLQMKGLFASV